MESQNEMMDKWMISIACAPIYRKTSKVKARLAKPGEHVVTMTADGKETENTANSEYNVLVTNPGGEQYLATSKKFQARYTQDHSLSDEDSVFQAKGRIKAIDVPAEQKPFEFIAAWGEAMVAKPGDMLATPINEDNSLAQEIYRIAKAEFEQTYELEYLKSSNDKD